MSQQLISRSPDLKRLRDEGYDLEIRQGLLLIKGIPYVNAQREIRLGVLVSELTLAGDTTATPSDHVVSFAGDHPCDKDGTPLSRIVIESTQRHLADGLEVNHRFSSKPLTGPYANYYEKMQAYIAMLSSPAQAIDPSVTAQTFSVIAADESESVFKYIDTASSRAGINVTTSKLELSTIAIVGIGGTGSYVLDLIAKTPVKEIHLFDGDLFFSHNAFRSPGAPSLEELRAAPKKAVYFAGIYGRMRHGIFAHDYNIDASNIGQLDAMQFVFLCMDAGEEKGLIVEKLEEYGTSFIDVGMGVELVDSSLRGILRVTSSTAEQRAHFRTRVSLADAGAFDEYDLNIQIADLNALNAALAVLKWKKLCGFYLDFEKEHHSTFSIDVNMLLSEDR